MNEFVRKKMTVKKTQLRSGLSDAEVAEIIRIGLSQKTITIWQEAYEALSRTRPENESFTEPIIRMTSSRG